MEIKKWLPASQKWAALYQTARWYITEDLGLKIQPSPSNCEWIYIFWL
jgi:hypothetical protein